MNSERISPFWVNGYQPFSARSAIVAELGNEGLNYWLRIRSLKEDYDEQIQMGSYMYLLARREKININLGAIINRYRTAINKYNNRLNQQ